MSDLPIAITTEVGSCKNCGKQITGTIKSLECPSGDCQAEFCTYCGQNNDGQSIDCPFCLTTMTLQNPSRDRSLILGGNHAAMCHLAEK